MTRATFRSVGLCTILRSCKLERRFKDFTGVSNFIGLNRSTGLGARFNLAGGVETNPSESIRCISSLDVVVYPKHRSIFVRCRTILIDGIVSLCFNFELTFELDVQVEFELDFEPCFELKLAVDVVPVIELDFQLEFELDFQLEFELDFELDFELGFELDFEVDVESDFERKPELDFECDRCDELGAINARFADCLPLVLFVASL